MANINKAKLSHKSLDAFVQKHTATEKKSYTVPYTTENGQNIFLNIASVYKDIDNVNEFKYLLGQAIPYHSSDAEFPIQDLAFIKNEDGSKQLWTRNSRLLSQFVTMANKLSFLPLTKGPKGEPMALRSRAIEPILHKEKIPE